MVITGLMDGVSVQDLFQNTMLYDAMQTVTGFKQFDTVVIPPNENLGAKLVNGINLPHLFSRAVMKVGPQTIAGDIVFRGPVRFENLWFHDTFDGVTDADLKRNWLLQGAHQVIEGDMVFDEDVVINGNLDISSGTINAINIRDLDRTIIKKDEPATIPGPITFREAIHSFGDVQVSGTVQGVKLASEAVIRHGNVQIGGHKVFLGNITVRQSMSVNGMIDNVHVNDLCKTVVTRFGNQVITSPTRITGTLTAPSMDVGGTIDSINLRRLNDTCVKFDEPSQVTGRKHFETLVLLGPVDVRGKVNGIDIRELDRTYFSKTRKQVIDAPVVFENGATFHGPLIVNGNMNTADGLLDGVNLQNIDQNYLKVEGDQVITAPYVFERDVHFHRDLIMNRSTVNNIPINWIALKNQSEYRISSDLDFQDDVMFRGNVSTRDPRGIDYVKLNKVRSAAGLTGPGKFVLNSVKHFGTVEVDHLLTTGLINGINFTRDNLLLTTGLNIVNGKIIFVNGLNIQSNLETRTINNVNFAELEKHLARRDADNVIEGDISIEGPVVADNAVVLSFVNDVNLTHLAHTVYGKIDFDSMRSRIDFCARKLDKLDKAIQGAATCLKEYQQVFEVNSTLITSESWSPIKTVFTSKNEGPCTRVQVHDKDWSLDYGFASTFLAYKPSSIAELSIGGDNFVIIATSRQIGQIAQHCVEGDSAGLRNVRRLGSGSSMIQVLKMNRKIGRYEPLALIRNEPVTDIRIIHSDVHVGCVVVATPFTNSTTIQFSPPMVLCVTRKGDVQIRRFEPSFALGSNAIATIRSEHQRMTFVATINSLSISEQAFNVKVGQWDVNVKSFLNISKEIFAYHPTAIHFAEFKDPQATLKLSSSWPKAKLDKS
ncbi:hypothetical protein HDE_02022 [Halotydeus destructor]|nr:hypothetical protein HDE_02022 [Halotydeus destructor]